MDQRTRSIIIGALALVILISIVGVIAYLGKASKNRTDTTGTNLNALSNLPVVSAPTPTSPATNNSQNTFSALSDEFKAYQGQGFNLRYPKVWGILTCSNSQNIEFDPNSGADVKNVVCDYAVKPVTIIVNSRVQCSGDKIRLGTNDVTKSKTNDASGDVNYRWCLNVGNKGIDITHRVSNSGARATSKTDFVSQIEQAISTLQAVAAGS